MLTRSGHNRYQCHRRRTGGECAESLDLATDTDIAEGRRRRRRDSGVRVGRSRAEDVNGAVRLTCSPSTLADPKVVTVTGEDEMMTLSKKIDAGEATPDDYDRLVALLQVDKVNDIARALRAIDCSLTDPRLAVDWETVFAAENVEFDIEGLEEVMTRVRRLLVQLGQLVTVTRHHNPNCPRCGNPMTEWQNKRTGVCGFKCTRSCRQRAYEARKAGSGT